MFRRYLLPGLLFQSIVIAGGYGTGRELAQFFLSRGPVGGLLAMAVATVIWSAVCATSFEFARAFDCYDYRHFFNRLIGRGWIVFEVGYLLLLLIVLAVIASAAGTILNETFALPYAVGVLTVMATVGFLVFRGSAAIERVLAFWSLVLYGVYVIFFGASFGRFGADIGAALASNAPRGDWFIGGVEYAAYNLALVPPVLFAIRHLTRRREAVIAGLLAGPIAMVPTLLFFLAMVGHYPAILDQPVPVNYLLEALGSRWLQVAYAIVLFGTLIETGTGMIHALNERIAGAYRERSADMPRELRPAIAIVALVAGTALARYGLIDLIARGYGTLTWLFLVVYVIPILTLGVFRLRSRRIAERRHAR